MADFARTGLLAGQSIAAVRGEEQRFTQSLQTQAEQSAADRQMTALTAAAKQQQLSIAANISGQQFAAESQQIAIAMQAQAAADRQRIALENEQEMQEYDAFLATQTQQRSQAWELEKVELTARNRFELEEQAYAMEFQATEANRIKRQQETQQKIAAINKSREQIGDRTADALILSLETGISQVATQGLRPEKKESYVERIVREAEEARKVTGKALSGDFRNVATNLPGRPSTRSVKSNPDAIYLKGALKNPNIDPETGAQIRKVLARTDPAEMAEATGMIKQTLEIMSREKVRAENLPLLDRLLPTTKKLTSGFDFRGGA